MHRINLSIADQVGIAIQGNLSDGQTFAGQGFSEEIPAGVTWYALSDAGNLNHLVSLTIAPNGTDYTASANVWLCRIDTGGSGTASALPTIAIMFLFTSGSLGVLGIVVERKRTRMAAEIERDLIS